MKVFSKAAFLSSDSGKHLKTVLGKHLNILDGMPILKEESGFGFIEYEVDGEEFELWPVEPEWCIEDTQERLF